MQSLFLQSANTIWEDIRSGRAVEEPDLLSRFLVVTFADIKKYRFYYWFGFPALCFPKKDQILASPASNITELFSDSELETLEARYSALREGQGGDGITKSESCFLVKRGDGGSIQVASLSDWDSFWSGVPDHERMVGFGDPGSLPDNPGWPLRNLLMLLAAYFKVESINILCYREIPGKKSISHSIVFAVTIPKVNVTKDLPGKAVGWEKDKRNKLAPRFVNLGDSLDPNKLAKTAVDLNLKLMKWRVMTSLDLEQISQHKCLLFGAGTLGCNVARSLMGWGVRNITFVDNGKVSYSNPVRQSLYKLTDCMEGGKDKATAAATSMLEIFPDMNVVGEVITIPMPGHHVGESQKQSVKEDCERIEQLIDTHDTIFLLTDSRESRWFPTVASCARSKLVINAALGFDTYLVMRHGVNGEYEGKEEGEESEGDGEDSILGCYFCNDVVAPQDSLSDRTLDQQCTVTRPGVSYLAATYATELLISILHHPDGIYAKAGVNQDLTYQTKSPLGIVPHQLRGFISHFTQMPVVGYAYDKCTACSPSVIYKYKKEGFEFLFEIFNNPTYLEDITGLSEMKQACEDINIEWEEVSDDDF